MQPGEYRRMAEVEDVMWYYRALHRHVRRELRKNLGRDAAVLDAGCGTGGLLRSLKVAQPIWRLVGLDVSPLAVELARQRTGAEVVEGSVERLPYAAESFEAIVSCDVLCQLDEPIVALREFVRCLRPGGVLILNLPAYSWMYSYHDRQVGNRRRFTLGGVAELLRAADLARQRATYWNTLTFPLVVVRRKIFPPRSPTSDVHLYPVPLEAIFYVMMRLEQGWLGRGLGLPFGSSILVVGRKSGHA